MTTSPSSVYSVGATAAVSSASATPSSRMRLQHRSDSGNNVVSVGMAVLSRSEDSSTQRRQVVSSSSSYSTPQRRLSFTTGQPSSLQRCLAESRRQRQAAATTSTSSNNMRQVDDGDLKPAVVPRSSSLLTYGRQTEQEELDRLHREEVEREGMLASSDGRAFLFVQEVLQLVEQQRQSPLSVRAVGKDDMVQLTAQMLKLQRHLAQNFKPSQVVIGFHYTDERFLSSIRRKGLMSTGQQKTTVKSRHATTAHRHGAVYGDGVYCGANPYAFTKYGDVGLMVAMLMGQSTRVSSIDARQNPSLLLGLDTIVGNKTERPSFLSAPGAHGSFDYHDELVLKNSDQVVPLLFYKTEDVVKTSTFCMNCLGHCSDNCSTPTSDVIYDWVEGLQGIIDKYMNGGEASTTIRRVRRRLTLQEEQQKLNEHFQKRMQQIQQHQQDLQQRLNQAWQQHQQLVQQAYQQQQQWIPGQDSQLLQQQRQHHDERMQQMQQIQQEKHQAQQQLDQLQQQWQLHLQRWKQQQQSSSLVGTSTFVQQPASTSSFVFGATGTTLTNQTTAFGTGVAVGVPSAPAVHHAQTVAVGVNATARNTSGVNPVEQVTISYKGATKLAVPVDSKHFERPSTKIGGECVICLDKLTPADAVQIKKCQHVFHAACIKLALTKQPKCPLCRESVGEPRGKSPSGTMSIKNIPNSCGGFDGIPSIQIEYVLPDGVQESYHDNPGHGYSGTRRWAYIPNTLEGRDLLKRLKYAWSKGMIFSIGTSLTTGKPNSVIWGSIHHKTKLNGGAHGFPDPGYFYNCSEELDALNVPKAVDL